MGDHFTLDVDVNALRRAQRRLGTHAATLAAREKQVRGAPERWRSGWTGAAAEHMADQARALSSDTRDFVRDFESAADAVKLFADQVQDAKEIDLPTLNRRWVEARDAYGTAVEAARSASKRAMAALPEDTTPQSRSQIRREADDAQSSSVSAASGVRTSTQQKLEDEYDDLVQDLKRAARRLSTRLSEAVALPLKVSDAGPFTQQGINNHPMGRLPSDKKWSEMQDHAERMFGGPAHDLLLDLTLPSNDLAEVTEMLERARGLGLHPTQYRETLEQFWFLQAAAKAGIDVDDWDPKKGAQYNEETIMKVYRYYGDLFLENEDLAWAGMANMIGPSFAGGFLDLAMIRDWARLAGQSPPGAGIPRETIRTLAGLTDEDLKFYETTLLGMQKNIFFDQGTAHEAYREGGMTNIQEMYEAGILDRRTYDGWQGIDSGDPERVQAGNEALLLREQHVVIDDDYRKMYDHPVTGQALTWAMTQIGTPSIPGAKSFADLYPLTVPVETPGPPTVGIPWTRYQVDNPLQGTAWVETPMAAGNVALFEHRWNLVTEDTLPAYQKLLRDDPDLARALIAADVPDRVEEYRLGSTWDDILRDLADWDVDRVEQ